MLKNTLIITIIIVVVIALGATATYITLRQGGEEVRQEQPVATLPGQPEEPGAQPEELQPDMTPISQPEQSPRGGLLANGQAPEEPALQSPSETKHCYCDNLYKLSPKLVDLIVQDQRARVKTGEALELTFPHFNYIQVTKQGKVDVSIEIDGSREAIRQLGNIEGVEIYEERTDPEPDVAYVVRAHVTPKALGEIILLDGVKFLTEIEPQIIPYL